MIAAAALLGALLLAGPQHAGHQHPQPPAAKPTEKPAETPADAPKEPIPPLTDADRQAAFPEALEGHAVHDRPFNTFILFDRLEWQGGAAGGMNVENSSWFGGDIHRVWIRADAESEDDDVERASVEGLWGRSFSRWWDVVAGVRQDFRPGDPQTWAAIGIQGLAPYWFEVEATAYIGADARTLLRVELEYELLLTNRLVLQPVLELDVYGKDDPDRAIGAGLSTLEAGVRLRYEIRRELAPYIGVSWDQKVFGTADLAREHGDSVGNTKFAVGLRTWF